MTPLFKKAAVFCLGLTFFAQSASAKLVDAPSERQGEKLGKPLAVVRVQNNKVECVQFAESVQFSGNLEIPLCPTEGRIAEEVNRAMKFGASPSPTKMAWLSQLAVSGVGCIYGIIYAWGGVSIETELTGEGTEIGTALGILAGIMPSVAFANMVFETARLSHSISAAVGSLVCGGVTHLIIHDKYVRVTDPSEEPKVSR